MQNTDPRKAKTLEEACGNGDGTYNGYRLLSWLSEVVRPGKGFSVEEVKRLESEARKRRDRAGIHRQFGIDSGVK